MTDLTGSAVEADRFTAYKEIDTGYRAVRWHEKTLYEQSRPGTVNDILPAVEPAVAAETAAVVEGLPVEARRAVPPALPELTEPEILRHYIRCSQMTFGYDSGSNVGVGTCTMKYSPRLERAAGRPAQGHRSAPATAGGVAPGRARDHVLHAQLALRAGWHGRGHLPAPRRGPWRVHQRLCDARVSPLAARTSVTRSSPVRCRTRATPRPRPRRGTR